MFAHAGEGLAREPAEDPSGTGGMRLTSECAIQKSSSALLTTTAPTVGSPAGPCTHPVQLRKHLPIEQVERRPVDGDRRHPPRPVHPKQLKLVEPIHWFSHAPQNRTVPRLEARARLQAHLPLPRYKARRSNDRPRLLCAHSSLTRSSLFELPNPHAFGPLSSVRSTERRTYASVVN